MNRSSFFCFFLAVCIAGHLFAEEPLRSLGVVVARLDGKEYRRTKQPIEADALQKEVQRLVAWVLNTRIETVAEKLGVSATEEEQRQLLAGAQEDLGSAAARIRKIQQVLPIALREALQRPEREEAIYHQYLDGLMSRDLWRGNFMTYSSADKIAMLEKVPPATTNDLVRPNAAVRLLVLKRNLREKIVQDVAVSSEEIDEAYTRMGTTNELQSVRKELEATLLDRKKEEAWLAWLRAQLMAAPVDIQNAELKAAYDRFLAEDQERAGSGIDK